MYQSDNWNWCACGEISDVIQLVQRRKALSLICFLECHLYTNKWFSKNLEKQMKLSLSNMQEPPKLQEWLSVQDSRAGRDSQIQERSRKITGKRRAGMHKLCWWAQQKMNQFSLLSLFWGKEEITTEDKILRNRLCNNPHANCLCSVNTEGTYWLLPRLRVSYIQIPCPVEIYSLSVTWGQSLPSCPCSPENAQYSELIGTNSHRCRWWIHTTKFSSAYGFKCPEEWQAWIYSRALH